VQAIDTDTQGLQEQGCISLNDSSQVRTDGDIVEDDQQEVSLEEGKDVSWFDAAAPDFSSEDRSRVEREQRETRH